MATQEIYIRNATETEARGPFTAQQVADLAEAGQVNLETLIYDAGTEQWVALNSNAELMEVVFPEKKKLVLKAKEIKTLNKQDADAKPITVNEMLAAAEGKTDETADKKDPEIEMARAAKVGMIGALAALVLAAAGEILPNTEALISMEAAKILAAPLVVLGVVDVGLAVLLALGMVTIYPFVRFRAALGFGLMGFMFYAQGQATPLIQLAVGCAGLYLCTVFVRLIPAIIAALMGLGGMGTLAWYFLSQ
jgi:hypothetical protein